MNEDAKAIEARSAVIALAGVWGSNVQQCSAAEPRPWCGLGVGGEAPPGKHDQSMKTAGKAGSQRPKADQQARNRTEQLMVTMNDE